MTAEIKSVPEIHGPSFPLSGEHYTPLVNETKDGKVYAHAYQTILASPEALYKAWSDMASIPLWQEYVVSVTPLSDKKSHWVMGDPEDADGKRLEFDSEVTEDEPGRKIAWQSITEGVDQGGSVTFTPHPSGRGTIVLLQQAVKVAGGAIGNAAISTARRGPKQIVIENLRHFKEMIEAKAIPSVRGQPHGPRGVSGKTKEWMYGENNPTPPGTSEQATSTTATHQEAL